MRVTGIYWLIRRAVALPRRVVTINGMRVFLFSALLLGCSSTDAPAGSVEPSDDAGDSTGGTHAIGTGGRRSTGGARATGGRRAIGGAMSTGGAVGAGGSTEVDSGGAASDAGPGGHSSGGVPGSDATASGGATLIDSGSDAWSDGAPVSDGNPCECSSGPCCDGCRYRPDTTRCGSRLVDSWCAPVPGPLCQYHSPFVLENWRDRFCRGDSAECNGLEDPRISAGQRACPKDTFCHGSTVQGGEPPPTCGPCL